MRVRAVFASLLAVALLSSAGAVAATNGTAPKPLDILVVAGQSNALGYQSFVVDPKTHKDVFLDSSRSPADSRVLLMWTESGVTASGDTPVKLDTPQRIDSAPSGIFGPELGLARKLYADGHHDLLVVKVAFSGTSLAIDWKPGQPDFQALVTRVGQAISWADSNGYAPSIAAFYWMQGETDATNASWAASYEKHLRAFIGDVRAALYLSYKTPFVIGQIDISDYINFEQDHKLCSTPDCSPERRWNKEVMDAQAAVASKYVFVAKTSSLPRYEDFLHLTDSAELRLGKEFAVLSDKHLT